MFLRPFENSFIGTELHIDFSSKFQYLLHIITDFKRKIIIRAVFINDQ